jgi:solute carrier family 13 (sodium-dependent dicarboxylate transporter), member 2/3/5
MARISAVAELDKPHGKALSGFSSFLAANIIATGLRPRKSLIFFALSWLFFFFILFAMPTLPGMTSAGKATLAVVVWACLTWIGEVVPVGITGLQIPMLLLLTGAVQGGQGALGRAASGFTSPAAFICLAAFIMAAIIQVATLDRRIALGLLHAAKVKTVNGLIWIMFVVNLVLALIIPGANPRAALQLPIINGFNKLLGDTPREAAARKAIVIQTMVYGSLIAGMCILPAHLPNLIVVGLLESQLKIKITYFQWFVMQAPYLGMFVLTQVWVMLYFRTRNIRFSSGPQEIERQYKALPAMSRSEWLIVGAFAATALLWMTEHVHNMPSEMAAVIGVTLLYLPGLFGFTWKAVQDRTIWGTYVMLAGALSLSAAMSSSGLGKFLAGLISPIAAGHPWWMILLIMMVGTHVIRIGMLSGVAAISLFAPILVALAPTLGLHPVAFTMLVADTDTFAYILPTQLTTAVIAYSSGTFSMWDYAKVGVVSTTIAIGYGILVMAHWYAYLGVPVWDPNAPWPF